MLFQTKHRTPMVRTQSIISVSDELGGDLQNSGGGSASNIGQDTSGRESGSVRKMRLRGRRGMSKALKNISGSSQEDASGKDILDRVGLSREEEKCGVPSCSPHRGTSSNELLVMR